jgi:hypothetical protein
VLFIGTDLRIRLRKFMDANNDGDQESGGLRGGIPNRYPAQTISCEWVETTKRISMRKINANTAAVAASGASTDRRGKIIAVKTKTGRIIQIPIFRIFLFSSSIGNPILILINIGFSIENVKLYGH